VYRDVFRPFARDLDIETASSMWERMLSRLFAWGWVSLLLILATGIGMVFLKFGGFSGVPMIHRRNMLSGIPAIVLFGYLFFGPWQQYRRTMLRREWNAVPKALRRVRVVMSIILVLGLVASVSGGSLHLVVCPSQITTGRLVAAAGKSRSNVGVRSNPSADTRHQSMQRSPGGRTRLSRDPGRKACSGTTTPARHLGPTAQDDAGHQA
jgi:uncharacterized membrane protein